jgi:hypothetical protein
LDSWEAEEDVKIAHAGEKSSWHKVSTCVPHTHTAVMQSREFAEMVEEGIRKAAAMAEVPCVKCGSCRSGSNGGLMAMVEIVFGGFCLFRTCNDQHLDFFKLHTGVYISFLGVYLDNSSFQNTPKPLFIVKLCFSAFRIIYHMLLES